MEFYFKESVTHSVQHGIMIIFKSCLLFCCLQADSTVLTHTAWSKVTSPGPLSLFDFSKYVSAFTRHLAAMTRASVYFSPEWPKRTDAERSSNYRSLRPLNLRASECQWCHYLQIARANGRGGSFGRMRSDRCLKSFVWGYFCFFSKAHFLLFFPL